jgi:hypothetical protein
VSGGRVIPLRLRSRQDMPRYPKRRQGALRDEARWIDSLSDRELAQHAAELGRIDRAVKTFRKKVEPPKKDAA